MGRFPFTGAVHIVTACNPGGRPGDDAGNAARHRELVDHVTALSVETVPTVGSARDGSMAEPGLLILGIDRTTAIEIGRRFGQRAVYAWSRAALEILDVQEDGCLRLGWALTRAGG